MVIELIFKNKNRGERRVQILVKKLILTELIVDNKTLIKLIRRERRQDEVLTGIRDIDV